MSIIYVIFGIVFLYFGGELLVNNSTKLAKLFGVSPLVIGLTIVALGTSCPELAAMLTAALKGEPQIAVGAIIGSNISNIALILGISALICPLFTKIRFIQKELPFMLFSSALFFPIAWLGWIYRIEGVFLLLLLGGYLWFVSTYNEKVEQSDDDYTRMIQNRNIGNISLSLLGVVGGIAFLSLGADWLIHGAVTIAEFFGIPKKIIGLTLVALGTSLPELASCVVAAIKKETGIILGNIIGSNIFNVLGILGATAVICPFEIHLNEIIIDLSVMMGISLVFFVFLKRGLDISRLDGFFLFVSYIAYIAYLFTQM
jgi:cation:H+ antiporter